MIRSCFTRIISPQVSGDHPPDKYLYSFIANHPLILIFYCSTRLQSGWINAFRTARRVDLKMKKKINGKNSLRLLLANHRKGALYTGVTSNLIKRIWQHKTKIADGFTKKYGKFTALSTMKFIKE